MQNFFSEYYQSSISHEDLAVLAQQYEVYCQKEELLAMYTENDVKLAIDNDTVDQDMINQLLTFQKQYT